MFLSMFSLGLRGDVLAREITIATNLAQEMIEEIKSKRFEDDTDPVFGRESNDDIDSSGTVERDEFDDVDDYDGWSATPPEDVSGNPLTDFSNFTRSVEVKNVDEEDYEDEEDEGTTNSKKITVTVLKGENNLVELTTVVVKY